MSDYKKQKISDYKKATTITCVDFKQFNKATFSTIFAMAFSRAPFLELQIIATQEETPH